MQIAHSEPPARHSRFSIVAGWGLVALCVIAGFAIMRVMLVPPHPHAKWAIVSFFAFALAALVGVGVSPTARYFRDGALLARWDERARWCPSCGAPRGDETRCVSCDHPLDDDHLYWEVNSRHWLETAAAALFAPAAASLAVFFAMVAVHARDTLTTAVVLWLFVLGFLAAAVMVAWFASMSLRSFRNEPVMLGYRRSWQRAGSWWYTSSKASLHGDSWSAEGQSGGLASDAPRADEGPEATMFERGLASVLTRWNTDDKAPLSAQCSLSWRLVTERSTAPSTRPDAVYREPAPTEARGETHRESKLFWTLNLNRSSLGELLEEEQLPVTPCAPDDDESVEIFDADWDVELAMIIRVFSRDEALRSALEARGVETNDDEIRLALDAVRASRSSA